MSSKKKTAAELLEAAKKAEARAKELKAKAKEQTKAEEAKINAEIIKAIKEWQNALPKEKRTAWDQLPSLFRKAGQEQKTIPVNYI